MLHNIKARDLSAARCGVMSWESSIGANGGYFTILQHGRCTNRLVECSSEREVLRNTSRDLRERIKGCYDC